VDLEPLSVDNDALDEKAEDSLPGVEVGLEKSGFQRLGDLLCAGGADAGDLRFRLLGLDLSQGLFCAAATFLDRLDPGTEEVQWKGTRLVRVRQAVALTDQLLETSFGSLETGICVRPSGGAPLDPGREFLAQGVRVE
jgi:hypothetical protein